MKSAEELWAEQDRHSGDRRRLFEAVGGFVAAGTVLYPGSYVDVAPSIVFPAVTYVDTDRRARAFFDDEPAVREIIGAYSGGAEFVFVHGDYTAELGLAAESFDLLVSLYAGFVSEHCTGYLRIGGILLVNSSHGDAAMASIDPRYDLVGVVISRSGSYSVRTAELDSYMVPKSGSPITKESIRSSGRGVAYSRSAFAYLFVRVA